MAPKVDAGSNNISIVVNDDVNVVICITVVIIIVIDDG